MAFAAIAFAPSLSVAQLAKVTAEQTIADAKAVMLADPDAARLMAKEAQRLAGSIRDPKARGVAEATASWLQGEAYLRTNDTVRARAPITMALASVVKLAPRTKLHADILLSRGGIDGAAGIVGDALRDYQAAFEIYRIIGDTRGQAMALVFIAVLYSEAMDQNTALRYYQQALDVYKSDPNLAISIYNNRGLAYIDTSKYDQAAGQFNHALNLATKLDSPLVVASILANIIRVDLAKGRLDLADRRIAKSLTLANDPNSANLRRILVALAAQSALQRRHLPRAVLLAKQAFAGLDLTKTGVDLRDSHRTAYDAFVKVGDLPSALAHLQALKRLDDATTKVATSSSTALMGARFDFANQELKISQLKADELERGIAFERARARTQRYVFYGASGTVAVIIAMLAVALFTIRRSRDKVAAANADLAITNSALGKALAAKTEFLATTSHEIRTPLNGILGMTEVMLADAKLGPAIRDRLNVVHGAGLTMRALVDDILDVAKMETGNLTIESAPFDLRATIVDAARMWEEQARAKGLTFDVDLAECPTLILGDATRVRQIVFNLLSNALKFTPKGRVSLSVDVLQNAMLRIAVSDSGIGISADKLEEIFESFRQADAGTTRQFGGTGLGLSICRNLARAMGGDVSVGSVVGAGATFTLLLPLTLSAAATESGNAGPKWETLVVDRNPITRSMFGALLAPHGGPVVFASTTAEALDRLNRGSVARVLIDDATVRAGGDSTAELRAIAGAGARAGVDLTLLWPVADDVERRALLATGVDRIVAKPVSGAALVAAMFSRSVSENNAIPDLVSRAA
ncbi:ATP-binding protein [Sphingomonas sp. PB2P19]|uniref:sensor histidine kinase n=1 Tax=Sphingomonas rhamnosi TaxID=3096156 RepID=UPI002FC62E17